MKAKVQTEGKAIGELLAGVLQFTLSIFEKDPAIRVLIVVRNTRTRDQYEIANVESLNELRALSNDCNETVKSKTTIEGIGVIATGKPAKGGS